MHYYRLADDDGLVAGALEWATALAAGDTLAIRDTEHLDRILERRPEEVATCCRPFSQEEASPSP